MRFVYDYMGRRVRKVVEEYDGSGWVAELDRRFVYYNWLPLLELDGLSGNAIVRKYTWGLDLAGLNGSINSLEQAGGIGGLLATRDVASGKSYIYLYDANGNVGQLIDLSDGSAAARYEYDPYGNIVGPDDDADGEWLDDAGPYAAANPYRFSTKYFDAETGLGYWGYGYYLPCLGRWISRDPIEEPGDADCYGVCRHASNVPSTRADLLGLQLQQRPRRPIQPGRANECPPNACRTIEHCSEGFYGYVTNQSRKCIALCGFPGILEE